MAQQYDEAIATYQDGLILYQAAGDATGERIILALIADTYADLENYTQSNRYQQQVLTIARRTNNSGVEAESLSALGYAHFMLGDYAQSVAYYQPALALFQQIGDRPPRSRHPQQSRPSRRSQRRYRNGPRCLSAGTFDL